ncbi:MAG: T9SS type A sorting domain-containing protein [Bacteroidetes bacterium]|nr:T9SS type A sorting domain-containing protein [Bacteroidota bacterium]
MAPGDTQEVVIAVIVAGAHSGSDYLSAITELKSFASVAKSQFLLTDINDIKNQIPKSFKLEQNYPNPFNPTTTISYLIPKASFVTLTIYDVLGKEVKTLVNKFQSVGKYNVTFNASNLSSGVYIYSIKAGNFSVSKKLVLMK